MQSRFCAANAALHAQGRLSFNYLQRSYQDTSPPLPELTNDTPERFVQRILVTQSPSPFQMGDTSQSMDLEPTTQAEHMWVHSPQRYPGFVENWHPDTGKVQPPPLGDAMSFQYSNHKFDLQYPHQGIEYWLYQTVSIRTERLIASNAFGNDFNAQPTPFGIGQLLRSDEPPSGMPSNFQIPILPTRRPGPSTWSAGNPGYQPDPCSRYHGTMSEEECVPEPLAALRYYEEALRRTLEHSSRTELREAASALRQASERLGSSVEVLSEFLVITAL